MSPKASYSGACLGLIQFKVELGSQIYELLHIGDSFGRDERVPTPLTVFLCGGKSAAYYWLQARENGHGIGLELGSRYGSFCHA